MKRVSILFFLLAVIVVPFFAYAQQAPQNIDDVKRVLENIGNVIEGIFWIIAVIVIFYAAFLFVTAGGDAEKVSKAKMNLLYALIAMVVAIMARGFAPLVRSILDPGN
jgi:type II secretory pathway component PulF